MGSSILDQAPADVAMVPTIMPFLEILLMPIGRPIGTSRLRLRTFTGLG